MRNSDWELPDNERVFEGHVSSGDRLIEFACIALVLMFGYTWIRYGLNMLFIILPLLLCAAYFAMYTLSPQRYVFAKNELTVLQRFSRTQHVPYESVFNMEYKKHDNMLNVTSENSVKLYCELNGHKRTVVCVPEYVDGFVAAVKNNCPVFWDKEED